MKKTYVMIHVIKHDMDHNMDLNYRRKIRPIIEDSHLEQSQRLRDRTKLENQESSSHAIVSKAFLYHKCNTMVLFGIKTSLTSL